MVLGLSPDVIDRTCYNRSFHTLALEWLRYLHSLDREAQLSSSTAKVADLQSKLGETNTKICEMEASVKELDVAMLTTLDSLALVLKV